MTSRRRRSLIDEMEHIAELEELKDLIDDDEEDELEDSVLGPGSSPGTEGESAAAPPSTEIEEEDEEEEEEDEEGEEVIYTAEDLGYEWQGEPNEEDLGYGDLGYEDQSQFTGSSSVYEEGSNAESSQTSQLYNAQNNANMMRRVSGIRGSVSGNSFSSAPEHIREEQMLVRDPGEAQRRSTFAGPPGSSLSRRVSSRRQNINLGSVVAPPGVNPLTMASVTEPEDEGLGGSGSVLQKMKSISFGSQRRSTALRNRRQGSTMSSSGLGSELSSIQQAASKLDSGSDSAFAAASVVAQSAQASSKRGHVQFNTDDVVLCMLTLLNVTNPGDDTDSFTVSPVNIHGYPPGEGKTEAERQGPYVFVMATVKKVHFDEDERYYTVLRADNGTEQRADTGTIDVNCRRNLLLRTIENNLHSIITFILISLYRLDGTSQGS